MEQSPAGRTPRIIPLDDQFELRPARAQHAEPWYSVADRNRARLREWLPWAGRSFTLEDIRNFLSDSERENAQGIALTLGIWKGETFCGGIGLHKIDSRSRSASIGYWLDEQCGGTGLMTRACSALVTEAFRHYGLHRVELRCAVGNEKSCAIARRLGFSEEGLLREAEWLNTHWADLRVFSMLEQYWTPNKNSVPRS